MSETAPPPASNRLMSLDALRGFDMFWIIGADSLVYALSRMSENPTTKFFATQLEHAEWAGFRFYDLIFPLFVFMVGASIVFSLTKIINESGRSGATESGNGTATSASVSTRLNIDAHQLLRRAAISGAPRRWRRA